MKTCIGSKVNASYERITSWDGAWFRIYNSQISEPSLVPMGCQNTKYSAMTCPSTRATPLGRPGSVYKSDIQCRFLSQNGQNDLAGQCQWPLFSIPTERIPMCIFGGNSVILAQIHHKLSHGQAKFPRTLCQNGQNDFEVQGQWPPHLIPTECIPWCMVGANLVIPAQICEELLCGQGKVYGRWTNGEAQATTIPLQPERSRGKKKDWQQPHITILHTGHSCKPIRARGFSMSNIRDHLLKKIIS